MSSDFLLDSATHDIDISSGTMQVTKSTELATVAQRIKIALLIRRGECFFNSEVGVPYLTELLVFKNNKAYIDQYLRTYIEDVEDVNSIVTFNSVGSSARQLEVTFEVDTLIGGTSQTIGVEL